MADNYTTESVTVAGATFASDDDGTAQWPYVKLAFGADNTQTLVGSISSNPLPVALSDTDNTVLDNIQTSVQLIDDPVFADDAAFTLASSKVMMSGAIRDDALSTLTAIEGDAVPLRVSSTGALHVTGGGGGTEYNEDVATPATITGTATVMERDDALTTLTPIEGDWAAMRCSAEGALWVQEFNSDAILADTANMDTNLGTIAGAVSGTEMQVDIVSGNVTNAGTFAVQVDGDALTALQLIDDAIVTDDAVYTLGTGKGVMIMGFAGAQTVNSNDSAALACNTSGVLHVNLNSQTSDITIADGGNTITVDWAASTNTIEVVGDVAHDAAAAGNPVAIAARATNSIEGLTQVAAADASFITSDLNGCLVTRPHTTLEENISERISDTTGTSTNTTNFAAGGAGVHNYITSATVYNSNASTSGYIDLRDGSAGSVVWTLPAPKESGCIQTFDPPLKFAANTAVAYDVSAAISTVYLSLNGFQAQG